MKNIRVKNRANLTAAITVALSLVLASCQEETPQKSPNLVLKRVTNSNGGPSLEGWNITPGPRSTMPIIATPSDEKFSEARLFHESTDIEDPSTATETVLKLNGFSKGQQRAEHSAITSFVQLFDDYPNSSVKTFFYEGQLDGQPAEAIIYTWSGKIFCDHGIFCTNVHVFMAPTAQFETLGGGAVIAVAWLEQDVPPSAKSMKKYGELPAEQAAQKLAQYVNNWMASYIQSAVMLNGQSATLNPQAIDSMARYNNALAQCAGWDCSISQGANGMWITTPD